MGTFFFQEEDINFVNIKNERMPHTVDEVSTGSKQKFSNLGQTSWSWWRRWAQASTRRQGCNWCFATDPEVIHSFRCLFGQDLMKPQQTRK